MICPLDFRYGREEIKGIFSEESRLSYWLKVEATLAKAHAHVGNIPKEAAEEIASKASLQYVKLERVKEIEAEIRHDVMAMVKALAEQCEYGKYVHLGATSYDIVDTANALQIIDALHIIEEQIIGLIKAISKLAEEHKATIMIGRTHGQHALPITFGLKMAVYAKEMLRHYRRLQQIKEEMAVGKMSGAVGSGAAFGDKFFEIQDFVMKELGLKAEMPATQIVGRDRYIALLSFLANVATSLEKFATEIRNLQRNEIAEVEEYFEEKQVGSSTMPHKRNPITCEQICGLARVIRSNLLPAWENAIQWHERDLCNSSAERFIIPHTLILTDWILFKMRKVFSSLKVNPEKMAENIEISKGLIFTEAIMIKLVEKGMSRQEAHEIMRQCAMEALEKGMHLKNILKEKREIVEKIDDIDALFNPRNYIGKAEELVELTLKEIAKEIP
ncbi:MAG TPA: adenylosuccinate lyase [Thermoplasmatales archaeon]|nr:adenylosuccinate lyase [Thermoplasmatales archaeon]